MLDTVDAALATVATKPKEELALGPEATSLDFLQAVYRDPLQPLSVRMRAASIAIPYETPKLSVSATVNVGFARVMEKHMERAGRPAVIDAKPNHSLTVKPSSD